MIISVSSTFRRVLSAAILCMITQSCEWTEDQSIAIYESASLEAVPDTKAGGVGSLLAEKLFWKAYVFGVHVNNKTINIEGVDFSFELKKKVNGINGNITVEIPDEYIFTDVYNSRMDLTEKADRLAFKFTLSNSKTRDIVKWTEIESSVGNVYETDFSIMPEQFKYLERGMVRFELNISTVFVTFFEKYSKEKPLEASLSFLYKIPPICKSTIHFKSLVLNEEKVKEKLGDNDWNNSAPETGLRIKYDGETVLYGFNKNAYYYNKRQQVDVFHTEENDTISIQILDVDYGFNASDIITDTLIRLRDFDVGDDRNLALPLVDKFMIDVVSHGRLN